MMKGHERVEVARLLIEIIYTEDFVVIALDDKTLSKWRRL